MTQTSKFNKVKTACIRLKCLLYVIPFDKVIVFKVQYLKYCHNPNYI